MVVSARFVVSSSLVSQCPQGTLPEFAFIGRSNVGKSSLINMLCSASVAKVSGTPGKTRLINHFLVNEQWHLVDLPGYGYAKASKVISNELARVISSYLEQRTQLTLLFLLIDIRHKPLQKDLDFINYLAEQQVPFSIIFTKADKLSQRRCTQNITDYKVVLSETWEELPTIFVSSAQRNIGREEILNYISEVIKTLQAII